jgi:transcriptional regulator with XRE-family HTH domain
MLWLVQTLMVIQKGFKHMPRLVIKEIAERQGLNQSQLQIKSGVTPSLLNRYWRNTADRVTLSELGKIARVLGVKSGDLIVDNGDKEETT